MAATTRPTPQDDSADLASFGYTQSLHRRLHFFSSFAAAFSYISPATGIFTLFILGIGTLGGAFIWTFPVVALGQFIVALNFAEVSSHFPIAGSVFQWTKLLSNSKPYAWFSGWIYLWAGALTVAAVVATLPLTLIPVINDIGLSDMSPDSLDNQKWIAIITLVVITLLNIFGVRVVAIINNTGVLFELLGLFVFAVILALFHNNQGVGVVFETGGPDFNASNFLVAMFMGLFVIYGFDTASTLAEETNEPRRVAPRAVLGSVAAAFIIGFIFLWAMLMAIPGRLTRSSPPAASRRPRSSRRTSRTRSPPATCWSSRSRSSSAAWRSRPRRSGSPTRWRATASCRSPGRSTRCTRGPARRWAPASLVAVMAAIFFLKYGGVAFIAIAASGMIYLSYILANLAILQARRRGFFERRDVPFSLGRWGMLVNILALVWGGSMLINFMWHRVATNPKPEETDGVLDFNIEFINKIPIQWSVLGAVLILGAIYYGARNSRIPSPVRSAEQAEAAVPG